MLPRRKRRAKPEGAEGDQCSDDFLDGQAEDRDRLGGVIRAEVGAPKSVAALGATPGSGSVCRAGLEIGVDPVRYAEPKLAALMSPYRPDTVVDGGTQYGLTLRAASVRGRSKRYEGTAREDDFCILTSAVRQAVVVAVADGMGAASRAALGAALAVRHAAEEVERQLAERAPDSLDWPAVFNRAASALVVEHRRLSGEQTYERPDQDEARAVSRDLGTTLTIAVVEVIDDRAAVSVAAIGDSPVYRLRGGIYERLVGERDNDEGFATTTVVALPYLPVPEIHNTRLGREDVLLICTDGFSEPLSDGNSDVGRLFATELAAPPPLGSWSYLVDFAKASYEDDRTLVAVWPFENELASAQ
jgi:serine/threonine protein phosphatase PrpC